MKHISIIFLSLILYCGTISAAESSVDSLVHHFDEALKKAHHKKDIDALTETICQAADQYPSHWDLQWRAARIVTIQSDILSNQYLLKAIQKAHFDDLDDLVSLKMESSEEQELVAAMGKKVLVYAERAQQLDEDKVESLFFVAVGKMLTIQKDGKIMAFLNGSPGKIQKLLDQAVLMNPRFAGGGVVATRGRLHFFLNEHEEAGSDFLTALTIEPHNLRARMFLGDVLYKKQRFDEAIVAWKKVVEDTTAMEGRFTAYETKEMAKQRLALAAQGK